MKLFTVVWIPDTQTMPTTVKGVLNIGGRIIDQNLTKQSSAAVEQCLKINGENLEGNYLTINQ
ncbi:hypothetical protein OW492_00305 [Psychromonas sp. 14N.309.X.WAT.B.A12]|uniref:hypothetical protein n=1 Tax=Psychromonas sp. 14N.309.X.WAT.B.A12 TaxID=2998322 RepID=UPI0025B1AF70|nr:hypothetical protein [Psychromonas sp. 14N.309.X.WAT.B.A12]MDN2661812.1 hypothetical protein [Psychromonas sp. 14N.309.X.WAT.B.A12]